VIVVTIGFRIGGCEIGLASLVDWAIDQKKQKKGRTKGPKAPFLSGKPQAEGGFLALAIPLLGNPNPRIERKREGGPTDGEVGAGDGGGIPVSQALADPRNTTTERKRDGARVRKSWGGLRNRDPCRRPSQPRPATRWRWSPSPATTSSSIHKRAKMVGLLRVWA